MSSCGDGAGGDEPSREETGLAGKMDAIIQEIFNECDSEKTGLVPAVRLVEFVAKYFNNCLTDWRIIELRTGLDPNNVNQNVDIAMFSSFWPIWVEKIQGDGCDGDERGLSFWQNHSHKETALVNGSQSYKSIHESLSFHAEKMEMEDKINELIHQNKLLIEDLSLAKSQLQTSEDQVEMLQSKLEIERRKNALEQQRLEEFQNLQAEYEKLQEEPEAMKKQIENMQKQISLLKKESAVAELKIEELENEKKMIDDAKDKINKSLSSTLEDLLKLESDFRVKEQEAMQLAEENLKLKDKMEELEINVDYYKNECDKYKAEKQTLEKYIRNKGDTKGNGEYEEQNSLHETSSEQDLFWKVQLLNNSCEHHESLQEEISHASINNSQLNCDESHFLSVKCDLNWVYYLNKQKEEISQLEVAQTESQTKLSSMEQTMSEMRVELSVQNEKYKILHEENRQLKNQLNTAKTELLSLQTSMQDYENIKEKFSDAGSQKDSLIKENTEKYVRILELQNRIEELEKQIREEVSTRTQENTKLNEIITKLRTENNDYKKSIDLLKNQNNSLSKDAQSAEDINELFNDKIKDLLESEENLKAKIDALTNENARLRTEIKLVESLRDEISNLQEDIVCKTELLKESEQKSKEELDNWQQKYKNIFEECEYLKKHSESLDELINIQKKEYEITIESLHKTIKEKESILLDNNYDLKTLQDCNNKLSRENKDILKSFKLLEDSGLIKDNRISYLETTNNKQCKEIENLKNEVFDLSQKEKETSEQIKQLQIEYDNINLEYLEVLDKYTQLKDSKDILEDDYNLTTSRINELNATLADQMEDITRLNNKVLSSRQEIDLLRQTLADKEQYINKVKEEISCLANENIQLKEKTEVLDEMIDKLKNNMQDALENLDSIEVKNKIREESLCLQCQELLETREQLAYLEHINQSLLKENECLKAKVDEFETESEEIQGCTNCDALRAEITNLKETIKKQSAYNKFNGNKNTYNKMEMVKNKMQLKIENLEQQICEQKTKIVSSSQEILQLNQTVLNEKNEKVKLEQTLVEQQKDYNNLKHEYEQMKMDENNNIKLKKMYEDMEEKYFKNLTIITSFEENITKVKKILNEKVMQLDRLTNNFLDVWKTSLSKLSNFQSFFDNTMNSIIDYDCPILNEQINELSHKLFFVEQLLKCLIEIPGNASRSLCAFCVNIVNIPSEVKSEKKPFALRPPMLLLPKRPDSPDSPSIQLNECDLLNNSVGCQTEEFLIYQLFKRMWATNIQGSGIMNILSSPSLSEEFTQRMNNSENETEWTEEELKQKYLSIIQAFTIDKKTLKCRMQQARKQTEELEEKLIKEGSHIYSIIDNLSHHGDCIEDDLRSLKRIVDNSLKTATSLNISYELLGGLKHEGKVMDNINIIISHVGCLKKNLQKYLQVCAINSSHVGGGDRVVNNVVFELNNIIKTLPNINRNNCPFCNLPINTRAAPKKMCFTRLLRYATYTVVLSMFVLSIFIFTNMVLEVEYSRRGYHSNLASWAELCVPWIKKYYPYGPPPL